MRSTDAIGVNEVGAAVMNEWSQVRWTEARQVVEQMGRSSLPLPDEGVAPAAHYGARRDAGARDEAVGFLGQALPRFEAVAWAARVLEDEARDRPLPRADRLALDHALRWLGDPSDEHRRAAYAAAQDARDEAPERILGFAVFLSGGSISMPDLEPVLPPAEAAGRLAAGAIVLAAHRSDDANSVLDRALDLGEKIAQQGTRALATA